MGMSGNGRRLCVAVLVIGGCLTASVLWGFGRIAERKKDKVRNADVEAVRAACWQMMFRNIDSVHPHLRDSREDQQWVVGKHDREFQDLVPLEIALLGATYARVSTNKVVICLSAFPRVYVLAFKTNVQQYGSEMLAEGLWLSSNPSLDREAAKSDEPENRPSSGRNGVTL